MYDRQSDLLPVAEWFYEGSQFDFKAIERSLTNRLLRHKSVISINTCHYPYKGLVQKSGRLSSVAARVPQTALSNSVMDALALQVDTQDAALALLAVLEDCINFIAAFGSGQTSHLSAETSLESFVCNTMLQVQVWQAAC